MSGCECKAGFFALRDCEQAVVGRCPACRRAMCRRHSAPNSPQGQCLDCAARGQQAPTAAVAKGKTARPKNDDGFLDNSVDDSWVYNYRHRYYSAGYAPIYAGAHHSTYYDQYDSRSFDQLAVERDDEGDHGDDGDAGFGDS